MAIKYCSCFPIVSQLKLVFSHVLLYICTTQSSNSSKQVLGYNKRTFHKIPRWRLISNRSWQGILSKFNITIMTALLIKSLFLISVVFPPFLWQCHQTQNDSIVTQEMFLWWPYHSKNLHMEYNMSCCILPWQNKII